MEWPVIILLVLIAIGVFVAVAVRGSFKSDDDFYGESTTVTGATISADTRDGGEPGSTDSSTIDGGSGASTDGGSGGGSDGGAGGVV